METATTNTSTNGADDALYDISVPDAPDIRGLTFRRFRGHEDYAVLLDLNTRSKLADGMEHDLHSLASITHMYGPTPHHDPQRDVLIAEVNGAPVGFTRMFWERELSGDVVYYHFGFVAPEWRGKGLGKAMIHWSERHARALDRLLGNPNTAYAATGINEKQSGLESLLKEVGYEAVRYGYHMETDDLDHIPDVPLPEGIEIRPAKPEDYRAVWDASVEAFRDHWGATEPVEGDFEHFLEDPENEPGMWVVAWDGDQIAGSILNFIRKDYNTRMGRKLGYTENISVRRPWRRKGLARAMLARSMQVQKEHGMTQAALGVDTQNPSGALDLYLSMGFKVVQSDTDYRKRL